MDQSQVDGIMEQARRAQGASADEAAASAHASHKVGLLMMALAGIAAIGTFATLFTVWYRSHEPDAADTLRIAMDEYVAGRFEVAERLTAQVNPNAEEEPALFRLHEFLLGASGIRKASLLEDPSAMRIGIADALPHLETLTTLGFPPGRGAEGEKILGQAYRELGRYAEAIPPLEKAIEDNPTYKTELLLPLAEVKLRAGGANVRSAQEDVQTLLAYPQLASSLRDEGQILQARIYAALGEWRMGRQVLQNITSPEFQDDVDLRLAELYMNHAQDILADWFLENPTEAPDELPLEAREFLNSATELLEQVVHRSESEKAAVALYLAARAYRISGQGEEALSRFASLRQNNKHPRESIAAGLEEVELLTEMRQYVDAMLAAKAIVREIADPRSFDPYWLSLREFRTRLEAIVETMREQRSFAESIELAKTLPPVVELVDAKVMQAESHRRWGQDLQSLAEGEKQLIPRRQLQADARLQFRLAGETFEEIAKLQFDQPEYIELIWDAIDSYQQGRAFEESLALLDDYLRYEQRSLLPRGLIAKGRALLALGQLEAAGEPLLDCIEEFPRDSLRYEARLLMAIGQLEMGKTDVPIALLDENLHDGRLSPESPLFRDSLFVTGEALYRQALRENLRLTTPNLVGETISPGDEPTAETVRAFNANQDVLRESILRLDEAQFRDQKHGRIDRARRARYLIAEAERLAAFWPGIVAADPRTIETNRRQLNMQRMTHLKNSHAAFVGLKSELVALTEGKNRLTGPQHAMFRNCFMGIADTLYEMNDLEAAAQAYQKVSQEFMNEPLALEAMLQQSLCYEKLGDMVAARRIFQQAGEVLKRIPDDQNERFARTTRYDRAKWESLIDWLRST